MVMAASEPGKPQVARELLLSLIAGSAVTLALAMLRAGDFVPGITEFLLRPGPYVAGKLGVTGSGGVLLSVLGDGIFYGAIAFLLLRLRPSRRMSAQPPQLKLEALTERRRAARLPLKKEVFVYGRNDDGNGDEPFSENTETLNVSAVGGLIPLAAKVAPAQKFILINTESNEELPCRVARTIRTPAGNTIVGFEFSQAMANFWQSPETEVNGDIAAPALHSAI
ncbi:MAG TPA: hypothetical protein VIY69_01930 [Candidatus Acidoferrales bacterium]